MSILMYYLFLLILSLVTHYIRTWTYGRHEAVTFEMSFIMAFFSLMFLWRYGFNGTRGILLAVLTVMFAANAFLQWHFFMELQDIMKKALDKRFSGEKDEKTEKRKESLLTMASVSIMPSFSRFIEESKLFNNPGSLIGLIKSIMKRQRFQKKKYLMRECFAENLNLIGPCKPEIDSITSDEEKYVQGAVHVNDLALGYKSERIGLISYDVLGFGAQLIIAAMMAFYLKNGTTVSTASSPARTYAIAASAAVFMVLDLFLRVIGFARDESVFYELSYTGMLIVLFRVLITFLLGGSVSVLQWALLAGYAALFLAVSFCYRGLDKAFHKRINLLFDKLIYNIPVENETDRTQRRFLTNLKTICEWTLDPFLSKGENKWMSLLGNSDNMKKFRGIMEDKKRMPEMTADLIKDVLTDKGLKDLVRGEVFDIDYAGDKTEIRPDRESLKKYPEEDQELETKIGKKRSAVNVCNALSAVAFIGVFVLIAIGII
ncbi:MAG: hypothetical protein J6U30_04405 [Oscillospiraceae bacterium]|nr:hypothetical protein [Oscillospiraceae bacterium]